MPARLFFGNYAKIARNNDIRARVDVARKRVYVPKRWQGKRIIILSSGDIRESKSGVLVNKQGFASVGKASVRDIEDLALIMNRK